MYRRFYLSISIEDIENSHDPDIPNENQEKLKKNRLDKICEDVIKTNKIRKRRLHHCKIRNVQKIYNVHSTNRKEENLYLKSTF